MRQRAGVAVLIATAVLVAGCIDVDTLVTVKPDGSGTIQETMLMSKEALQQMQAMMASMGGPEGAQQPPPLFDEAELQRKAAQYGEGVTYVSGEPLATESSEGFKVIYAFRDINQVRLNQNPGDKLPSGPTGAAPPPEKELMTFKFIAGSPNTLTVTTPRPDPSASSGPPGATPPENQQADPQAMAMMQQMFKDMKVRLVVRIDGTITETNATHREGNEVTVMEIDFNTLLGDPERLQQMATLQSQRLEEVKDIIKDLEGMKLDLNDELTIRFR